MPEPAPATPTPTPNRLARHGALYTVGVVIQGVATLLVLPFVTRLLGVEEYGKVAVGLSIIQVGTVLALAGLPAAITRAHFDRGDGPDRARAMIGMAAGISVAVVVLAAALRGVLGDVVALSLAAVAAMVLVSAGQAGLRAQGRPGLFVTTAIGSTAGAHVVGLAVAAVHPDATAYLAGYLGGAGATAGVAMLLTPPRLPWRVEGAVREALRIGLPVLPHAAALLILTSGDPLIVSRILGAADAGRYQVGMLLGLAPLAVLAGVNNAWAPAIMGAAEEHRWDLLARTMRPVVVLAAVCAVGLSLAAPIAVTVLASPDFGPATVARLVQVISVTALAQAVYLGASSVLFTQKRTLPLAFSTPAAAAVFVACAVPLTAQLGLYGMALAKVIGFAVLAVTTMIAARSVADVRWGAGRWLPVALGAVLVVAALLPVPHEGRAAWVQLGLAVLLGLAGAVAVTRSMARHGGAGRDRPVPRRASG